jgi:redox-sensitive bicupin YhaK (pirin superfamily)
MIHLRRSHRTRACQFTAGLGLDAHFFFRSRHPNPEHMHFCSLRVINEDHHRSWSGFPTHPYWDMEILTYVVSGAVAHKDSTGGEGVIRPGQLQYMSAGTGVRHSEFNGLRVSRYICFKIWILPDTQGLTPKYEDGFGRLAPPRDRSNWRPPKTGGTGPCKSIRMSCFGRRICRPMRVWLIRLQGCGPYGFSSSAAL